MSDRKVKRLTPNSIANLVMADEAWHDSLYVKAEDYDSLLADFEALRAHLAAEQENKTPAWWRDGLAATLMREGVNKHRAREIAVGYWEAYCQIPGNKEDET